MDSTLDRLMSLLPRSPLVTVIPLTGVIGRVGGLSPGLSLGALNPALEQAFRPRRLAAVALAVNSPGGSPAQSSLIAARIRQLADEKGVPVLAFVEDVAASGGYWLASAADEIFADETSILGSIGVVSAGFGFSQLLERLGIERRVHARGARKAMLDPFRPEKPEEVERLDRLQGELHELFKAELRRRRGDRLRETEGELFEGDIWLARHALQLGLIDGIGSLHGELRRRFGDKVRLRVVGPRVGWLRRRLGMAGGGRWLGEAVAELEDRAIWGRYGL